MIRSKGGGTKKKEGKTQLIKHDKKQGGRNKNERRKNTTDQT